LFGQKRVAILQLDESPGSVSLTPVAELQMCDWIWDVAPVPAALCLRYCEGKKRTHSTQLKQCSHTSPLPNIEPQGHSTSADTARLGKYLAFGFAHNFIEVWNWKKNTKIHTLRNEPCILYSLSFQFVSERGTLLVASGTVFNKILIWDIFGDGKPLYTLAGHQVFLPLSSWMLVLRENGVVCRE